MTKFLIFSVMMMRLVVGQSIFKPVAPTGLPYTIIISELRFDNGTLPLYEAEIGVFDDTLCVGSVSYENKTNVVLTAWKGDSGLNLPGFESNHLMKFKIGFFEYSAEKVIDLLPFYVVGDGQFGYGSYSIVTLEGNITQVKEQKIDELEISIFPNPFNNITTLQIKSNVMNEVVIRITDTTGKTLVIRNNIYLVPGVQNIILNEFKNFSSGAYFIFVEGKEISKNLKLVYLK